MEKRVGVHNSVPTAPLKNQSFISKEDILHARKTDNGEIVHLDGFASRVYKNSYSELLNSFEIERERLHHPHSPKKERKQREIGQTAPDLTNTAIPPRKFYDFSGKLQDTYTNRRRFLSRGFIATALVFGGTGKIGNSFANGLVDNEATLKSSPQYLSHIPAKTEQGVEAAIDEVKKIPGIIYQAGNEMIDGIESVPDTTLKFEDWFEAQLSQLPSEIKPYAIKSEQFAGETVKDVKQLPSFLKDQYREVTYTEIGPVQCTIDGKKQTFIKIDLPYFHPRAGYTDEQRCAAKQKQIDNLKHRQKKKKTVSVGESIHAERNNALIGAGLATAGAVIATTKDSNHSISRRKLLNRAVNGAVSGILFRFVDLTKFIPH